MGVIKGMAMLVMVDKLYRKGLIVRWEFEKWCL